MPSDPGAIPPPPGPPAAKTPVSPVAGPYGHPFHPIAVTVPIGSWTASALFDVLSRRSREPRVFTRGSRELIRLGLVGAVFAASLGWLDYRIIPAGTPAAKTASAHLALNAGVVALYALNLRSRSQALDDPSRRDEPVSLAALGLSSLALALLGASGWLGGMLSYTFGVRVADEGTQRTGFTPG